MKNIKGFGILAVILAVGMIAAIVGGIWYYKIQQAKPAYSIPVAVNGSTGESNQQEGPTSLGTLIPNNWNFFDSSSTGSNDWAVPGDQGFTMSYPKNWQTTTTDTGYGEDIIFDIPLSITDGGLQLIFSHVATNTQNYFQYGTKYDIWCSAPISIGGQQGVESGGISGVGEGSNKSEIAVIYDSPDLYKSGLAVQLSADLPLSYRPSTTSSCIIDLTKSIGGNLTAVQTALSSLTPYTFPPYK